LWCDLAKEILKRFSKSQNIEYLLTKKCYEAKILHGGQDLTADENLINQIKKV
jgi:hypothetical protein